MSTSTNSIQTFNPNPSLPTLHLPALACDAHVHIFGPVAKFPFADDRNITPMDATKETLFALHKKLGVARCVIVQSMVHGFDNRVVIDAMQAAPGRYLGVALVPTDVADAELARLAHSGIRGIRFHFVKHFGTGIQTQQLVDFSKRLKPHGLHLQLHFSSDMIEELTPAITQCVVTVMIDHMGRVDAREGINGLHFLALCSLLKNSHVHVKVSGADRIDRVFDADPPYPQGIVIARQLMREFPDQCVWGTDWPHPNQNHFPDDGKLIDNIALIATTPAEVTKLMVTNPHNFYSF